MTSARTAARRRRAPQSKRANSPHIPEGADDREKQRAASRRPRRARKPRKRHRHGARAGGHSRRCAHPGVFGRRTGGCGDSLSTQLVSRHALDWRGGSAGRVGALGASPLLRRRHRTQPVHSRRAPCGLDFARAGEIRHEQPRGRELHVVLLLHPHAQRALAGTLQHHSRRRARRHARHAHASPLRDCRRCGSHPGCAHQQPPFPGVPVRPCRPKVVEQLRVRTRVLGRHGVDGGQGHRLLRRCLPGGKPPPAQVASPCGSRPRRGVRLLCALHPRGRGRSRHQPRARVLHRGSRRVRNMPVHRPFPLVSRLRRGVPEATA